MRNHIGSLLCDVFRRATVSLSAMVCAICGRYAVSPRAKFCLRCFKTQAAAYGRKSGGNTTARRWYGGNASGSGSIGNVGNESGSGSIDNAGNASGSGSIGNAGNLRRGRAKKRSGKRGGQRSGVRRSAKRALVVKKEWLDLQLLRRNERTDIISPTFSYVSS